MVSGILGAFLMAIIHGVTEGGEVCLTKYEECQCGESPPAFKIPKPSFCFPTTPIPPTEEPTEPCCIVYKTPILTGGIIAIICIIISLCICCYDTIKNGSRYLIFISFCGAQLCLFVVFVSSVYDIQSIALGWFVDYFLFVSMSLLLAEAIAIYLFVLDKSIASGKWIVGVCCWGIPLLKSAITVAVDRQVYKVSECDMYSYVLGTGRCLNLVNIASFTILCVAIVVSIVIAIVSFLLGASPAKGKAIEEKQKRRCEVRLRIFQCSTTCLCFFAWIIAILVIGICQPFHIVVIIFSMAQGFVILCFSSRHVTSKWFCDVSGSPQRSSPIDNPLPDGDGENETNRNGESIPIQRVGGAVLNNEGIADEPKEV